MLFPTTLGEGSNDTAREPKAPPRRAPEPAPAKLPTNAPPDPEPLRIADQWEYELAWDAGVMKVVSAKAKRFPTPVVTARKMGRFAIELWIGPELVERVRFDFPLLAAEDDPGHRAGPSFDKGAHVRQRVLVPAAPRARRARLVDRATSEVVALPWPPDAAAAPSASP